MMDGMPNNSKKHNQFSIGLKDQQSPNKHKLVGDLSIIVEPSIADENIDHTIVHEIN
jgi:hypothetical protein